MLLAIADPPYLGRANRWYGSGRGHAGGIGRAAAHEAASDWDDPATHEALVARLEAEYDGWAIAASASSVQVYQSFLPADVRMCIWHKGNAIPSGSRVAGQWEPVFIRVPSGRSGHGTGAAVSDVLTAGISYRHNYVGSKPYAWTHCVLDLFAGSGAVTLAAELYEQPASQRCASCGDPITQRATGRPRRTCTDTCRRRLARRGY